MRYEFRPLTWTDKETSPRQSSSRFKARWSGTLELLAAELRHLEAVEPVVFQVDVAEADIRMDGMLRANARPAHPGAAISFTSKYGPLRYATDVYEQQWSGAMPSWQANVRGIALALAALRAVDRYGVTRRGEQYAGWKALPAPGTSAFATGDEALRWMREQASRYDIDPAALPRKLYQQLARRLHPDAGGDPAQWALLDAARQLLELR